MIACIRADIPKNIQRNLLDNFPHFKQNDAMDCGPTCLRMIAKHYGKTYSLPYLRKKSYIDREGVSLLGISEAAEHIGFRTLAIKISFERIWKEGVTPFIAHWKQKHFIVVYKITASHVFVADPASQKIKYTHQEFKNGWISTKDNDEDAGIALLLEATPKFFELEGEKVNRNSFRFLYSYFSQYKKLVTQLMLGLLAGSLLQLIFPFLTQSIVDTGIQYRDINFINLILIAQIVIFIGQLSVEVLRGWILLHLSTRINISLISDFLIKLMKLPISFFDSKMLGDITQRINDHNRIREFLTNSSLSTIFSVFNLLIFGIVLLTYSFKIFVVFVLFSALYLLWVLLFLKRRKELDYKLFDQLADNQSKIFQLINGIQEIKLTNSETQKRWEWERIQARVFRINVSNLSLEQYQSAGASFLNQMKNILIAYLAAKAVLNGTMSLGMMLAVQYIIGQLNAPLNQLVSFIQLAQNAKISLDRIGEIHSKEEEEEDEGTSVRLMPSGKSISLKNVSFQYGGSGSEKVLDNVSIRIPEGKVTAIVGTSGSGKTTLIKLLLKFYKAGNGEIRIGEQNLNNLSAAFWRSRCGVVMQDGFIFSDTIARNIAVSDEVVDVPKLMNAVRLANIDSFIETLPLGYNTKIGPEGIGLSQGQKQRVLIARSIYKNPDFLFFDEATNALDSNNERTIVENLNLFFKGRTAVIVAHRLSTVKHADQIIVLEKGAVIEQGTHEELSAKRGAYFELVKNQLELGN